jgi:CheY-like chemotaxis protein
MDPQPSNTRGRVLIADDDQGARDSLLLMLRRLGYNCESAATAEQALAWLRAAPAEVLLSDIHMPGNVKLELVEAASKVVPGLPVVLLTGRPSVETAARSVRLPVSAYLTKPPDLEELTRELDRAIAGFREYTLIQAGRKRLQDWDLELSQIEAVMRHPSAEVSTGALEDFIRVSLRQAIMTLADLERATQVLDSRATDRMRAVEHVAALRHAVEVLERTRQNFKSKDLADLRRQLEQLLTRSSDPQAGDSPQVPPRPAE